MVADTSELRLAGALPISVHRGGFTVEEPAWALSLFELTT